MRDDKCEKPKPAASLLAIGEAKHLQLVGLVRSVIVQIIKMNFYRCPKGGKQMYCLIVALVTMCRKYR